MMTPTVVITEVLVFAQIVIMLIVWDKEVQVAMIVIGALDNYI